MIRERNGRFEIRIALSRDPLTGKRRQRWVPNNATTLKAARTAERDALYRRDHGTDVDPSKLTLGDYLAGWLDDYAAQNVAPSTLVRYRQIVTRLSAVIGDARLQEIRPAHVSACHTALLEDGLSRQTVVHHHRLLRQALKRALALQLIVTNPADVVRPPRVPHREMQALTPVEVGKLLSSIDDNDLWTIAHIAITTGMRLGELLGLRWSDVDLDDRQARVERAAHYVPREGVVFREPKTRSSRRMITLTTRGAKVLRAHRVRQSVRRLEAGPAWQDGDLVFSDLDGSPLRGYNVSHAFKRAAKAAGFDRLRFHDTRHTAATLMLRGGVNPKLAAARLGHSNPNITLATYSHVQPDMDQHVADVLDVLLEPHVSGSPGGSP